MGEEIFRKKSLDRIKSPDSLNDYVRVANPGVWLLMAAVILFLAGVCVWSVLGHIRSTVKAVAHVDNGIVTCYVEAADIRSVKEGMPAEIDGNSAVVSEIGSLDEMTGAYSVILDADMEDGVYLAEIITENIRPISFVLN